MQPTEKVAPAPDRIDLDLPDRRGLAAGASDYITKPVDVESLLSLLRVWLERRPPPRDIPEVRLSN